MYRHLLKKKEEYNIYQIHQITLFGRYLQMQMSVQSILSIPVFSFNIHLLHREVYAGEASATSKPIHVHATTAYAAIATTTSSCWHLCSYWQDVNLQRFTTKPYFFVTFLCSCSPLVPYSTPPLLSTPSFHVFLYFLSKSKNILLFLVILISTNPSFSNTPVTD